MATESFLGVRPADKYLFFVITSPVSSYYAEGLNPVKIWVEEEFIRAAPGGLGAIKAGANYAASLAAFMQAKAKGFSGSKVKIGKPHGSEDYARLSAVRAAVGDGFEIMTDCNQGFTVDEAIRRAARLKELDLAWIEEPLPADDLDGHIRLTRSTPTPIAVGESMYSIRHFREYMQKGACSIVQVDVARIGGITPWLKVAHAAEAFDIPVCPHFLMELHVSLCAAVPNARWVEYIPQLDTLATEPMRIEDGHAIPSDAPGIGIAWDFKAIEQQAVHGSAFSVQ